MQATERTARVLLAFATDQPTLGVTEIARRLGLGKSAVHRALEGLVAGGLVMREPESSLYRLGPRAIELGLRAVGAADIRALALPFLFDLRDATGETATLSLLIGSERAHLAQIESEQEVRMSVELGRRLPLYAGASGHAILAFLPDDQLAAYFATVPLTPLTQATITDERRLRTALERTRALGYAVSAGERSRWASAVAAPVRSRGTVIGSVGICGPHERFTPDQITRFAEAVTAASAEISDRMS